MPRFMFQLQTLNVHNQRGKTGDVYTSAFGVEVGARTIGPLGRQIGTDKARITSGMNIDLSQLPPDNPPGKWGLWAIGPVEVSPDDSVSIDYGFVNIADSSGLSAGDQIKIETATLGAIVGVAGAATGIAAVPAAIIGGVVAVFGEIAGDLIGDSPPKCNGVAFANKITLTGKELADQVSAAGGTLISTHFSSNPDIPSACGHPSGADVTFAVVAVPSESVRFFLGRSLDLSLGIRKAMNLAAPTSLRSLIEE
jgi:hypothetical protein